LKESVTKNYYETIYEVQKQKGYYTPFSKMDDKAISELINYPWSGANFSDRIWNNQDELKVTLKQQLTKSIINGKAPKRVAKELSDKMDVDLKNAMRLVVTEHSYIMSESSALAMKETGVEEYEFLATLDSRTSETCQDLNGQVFKLKDRCVGVNASPMHVNCRSTEIPYIENDTSMRIARDEDDKNIYVPSDIPYKEWKEFFVDGDEQKRMEYNLAPPTDEFIKSIAEKYKKAYTIGKKGVDRFYDDDGKPIYPLNNGGIGKAKRNTLKIGTFIDRYGYNGGKYVSPRGIEFTKRALSRKTDMENYHVFKVIKDIEVEYSIIAPWFGEEGLGVQYKFDKVIEELLNDFLEEVK
jgi:SPP1 gp7 family putative phage head morphogenesis protein